MPNEVLVNAAWLGFLNGIWIHFDAESWNAGNGEPNPTFNIIRGNRIVSYPHHRESMQQHRREWDGDRKHLGGDDSRRANLSAVSIDALSIGEARRADPFTL